MKQKLLLLTMLLVATATGAWAKTFTPEYVNLGLPSGTLWATCNVGATSPEQNGSFFALGEVEPKTTYTRNNYKWGTNPAVTSTLTKYCDSDGLNTLLPEDDAATVNWGDEWCMPTRAQVDELIENCNVTTTTLNGKAGYLYTSKINSETIFFPNAGYVDDANGTWYGNDERAYYWTSTAYEEYEPGKKGGWMHYNWNSVEGIKTKPACRGCGMPVRPVKKTKPNVILKANPEDGGTVAFKVGDVLINEDFESYNIDGKIAQQAGNPWATFSNTPGSSEDGVVKGDADNKYGEITYFNDQILLLGDKESGHYEISFDAYVPDGNFGYFNILHDFQGSSSICAFQCYLNANEDGQGSIDISEGHGSVHAGSKNTADIPCVYDQWMHFRIDINIDSDVARLYYTAPGEEEGLICQWQWSLDSFGDNEPYSKLAALDFFSFVNNTTIRIDNICMKEVFSEMDEDGRFQNGNICVVTATPNEGTTFVGWEENGEIVSTDQEYSFTFTEKTTLTANFLTSHDLTLSPAQSDKVESITVEDTAVTPDENGVIKKIKPGKKVVLKVNSPDYIIRKATLKKTVASANTITIGDITLDVEGCETWQNVIEKNSEKISSFASFAIKDNSYSDNQSGVKVLKLGDDFVVPSNLLDLSKTYTWTVIVPE